MKGGEHAGIPEGVGEEYDQNPLEECMKLSKLEFRIML